MVKVCEKMQSLSPLRRKRGIGIVEVLIAAAVLGFLYMAVLNLHNGNREALLRIRGRDGATEVAQNLIDSLGALGLASLSDDKLVDDGTGGLTLAKSNSAGAIVPDTINVSREWKGQPGILEHTMKVDYKAVVSVSSDADYMTTSSSMLSNAQHVYAKRIDVKVSWRFKNSEQSITVSGVVR